MQTNDQNKALCSAASSGTLDEIQEQPLKQRANVNKTDLEQALASKEGIDQFIYNVITICITNEKSTWEKVINTESFKKIKIYPFDINITILDEYHELTLLQCVLGYDFNGPVLEFLLENGADIQQPSTNDNKRPLKMALERNNYKAIAAMLAHHFISHGLDSAQNLYTEAQQGCGKNIKQEDIIEAFTQKREEYSSGGKQDLANVCEVLKKELFKQTRLNEVDAQSLSYDKKIV